jgi:hypothetical protein
MGKAYIALLSAAPRLGLELHHWPPPARLVGTEWGGTWAEKHDWIWPRPVELTADRTLL